DLIVLDLMMPVLDGLGFLERLGKIETARPPVLVFSASASPDVAEQARQAGAAAVARKPIDKEEFVALVRSLTGG
ncbi:MAG: response regulator, partial [Sphingomicrobium sp.]